MYIVKNEQMTKQGTIIAILLKTEILYNIIESVHSITRDERDSP